jgi:hypothetical protein
MPTTYHQAGATNQRRHRRGAGGKMTTVMAEALLQAALHEIRVAQDMKSKLALIEHYRSVHGRQFGDRLERAVKARGGR